MRGPRSAATYPAADPSVIGVTATDADDKCCRRASRGPQVAIVPPGVDVLAQRPGGSDRSVGYVFAARMPRRAALVLARKPGMSQPKCGVIGRYGAQYRRQKKQYRGRRDRAYDAINSRSK